MFNVNNNIILILLIIYSRCDVITALKVKSKTQMMAREKILNAHAHTKKSKMRKVQANLISKFGKKSISKNLQ